VDSRGSIETTGRDATEDFPAQTQANEEREQHFVALPAGETRA
jgi:hypothetical protein